MPKLPKKARAPIRARIGPVRPTRRSIEITRLPAYSSSASTIGTTPSLIARSLLSVAALSRNAGAEPRASRSSANVGFAVMSRSEFLDALRSAPDLAVALLVDLSDHLRRANARVTARKSERIPARVGNRLVELVAQVHRHSGPSTTTELTITQDDLAGWIGATRESTARALARLRRSGLIETKRGRIVVVDLAGLEAAATADA